MSLKRLRTGGLYVRETTAERKQRQTKIWYRDGFQWWKIRQRVMKSHIGKHINDAYSQYCKLVPVKYKKDFWQALFRDTVYGYRFGSGFYLDENNIIYCHKRIRKKKPTIKTLDYQTELLHEISKRPLSSKDKIYTGFGLPRLEKYKYFVIQGAEYEFDSRRNKQYRKLKAEWDKAQRKRERENKRLRKERAYEFLSKKELELKKLDALDKQKLYAHGFDDESFKGEAYQSKKKKK
jgi:hypothetical protein